MEHDHRFMAQIVAPPVVDRPASEAAARALQLFSVASQGVNSLTKVLLTRNSPVQFASPVSAVRGAAAALAPCPHSALLMLMRFGVCAGSVRALQL